MPSWKRHERIGDCDMYLGDCREVLPDMETVDGVVTSPPYDGLRDYGDGFDGLDWETSIRLISENLSAGGVFVWNVADATVGGSETGTSFRQALFAMECGLRLHDTMIYIKDNVNFPEDVRYFSGFEYMFVFSKGAPKTFNPIKDRPNKWAGSIMHGTDRRPEGSTRPINGKGKQIKPYGMRFNYWRMTNYGDRSGHPAPMPYAMAHDHITSWTSEGDTVLDPYLGSGTTLVACAKLGRKGIGIELDEQYFQIACERVEDAYRQGDLFIEQNKKQAMPEQMSFLRKDV